MKIGINWASSSNYKVIQHLRELGCADFIEIAVDNFLHFNPADIKALFPKCDFSFHILNSRFLERDEISLKLYAKKILNFIEVLNPFYVSDHIGIYSAHGRQFPAAIEIDYEHNFDLVVSKIKLWPQLLGAKIYFENFPALQGNTLNAAAFFQKLLKETGCGILFDFSNAIVADKNKAEDKGNWANLAVTTPHFHVGGYRTLNSTAIKDMYVDTHDVPLSEESLIFLAEFFQAQGFPKNTTLVIERDHNLNLRDWEQDIKSVRQVIKHFKNAA